MFDRLNRLGVSLSFCVTTNVITELGEQYPTFLTKALMDGKHVRLIGDNLNFSVGTSHETQLQHKHLVHMFLSTALISDHLFLDKPVVPEINFNNLSVEHMLLSPEEFEIIRRDLVKIVVDTAAKHLPQLQFCRAAVPATLASADCNSSKTTIVPLPCLPYNEMYYQDDVKILDWYEQLLAKVVQESGIGDDMKFVVGGDQLTRERFTEALLLRLGNLAPHDRFAHIGRCVSEFFHLGMNYMEKVIFGPLWNKEGRLEAGTLRGECERISRHGVDPNPMKAYDDDVRFVNNFTSAYVVEAVMDYFGMDNRNDVPRKNSPPQFDSEDSLASWVYETFGEIINKYAFPCWSGNDVEEFVEEGKIFKKYFTINDKNKFLNGLNNGFP